MGPEVSDEWTKLLELELKDSPHKLCEERAERFSYKIDGERAEGLSYKIVGEHVAGLSRKKRGEERAVGFTYACRNCSCRKTNSRHLVCVERSRMVDGHDGCDGDDGRDGIDGFDGFDGFDGYDGGDGFDSGDDSAGRQIERIGVDDELGYDYPGKMAVPLDDFCPESEFRL